MVLRATDGRYPRAGRVFEMEGRRDYWMQHLYRREGTKLNEERKRKKYIIASTAGIDKRFTFKFNNFLLLI